MHCERPRQGKTTHYALLDSPMWQDLVYTCGLAWSAPPGAEFQIGDALDIDHAAVSADQNQLIASKVVGGGKSAASSSLNKIEDDDNCVNCSLPLPPVGPQDAVEHRADMLLSLCESWLTWLQMADGSSKLQAAAAASFVT